MINDAIIQTPPQWYDRTSKKNKYVKSRKINVGEGADSYDQSVIRCKKKIDLTELSALFATNPVNHIFL